MTGTLHKALQTFMIISRSVPLRTRNISDRNCRENQNIFMFSNGHPKIVRDSAEKYGRAGQTSATNTALALCMLHN